MFNVTKSHDEKRGDEVESSGRQRNCRLGISQRDSDQLA